MRNNEKLEVSQETLVNTLKIRLKNGVRTLKNSKLHKIIFCTYFLFALLVWDESSISFLNDGAVSVPSLTIALVKLTLPLMLISGSVTLLILFGTPLGTRRITNELRRVGITNKAGETPILLSKLKDEKQEKVTILEFASVGIPICEWEDKKANIESGLNVHIVRLKEGKNKRTVLLYTVSADNQLLSKIQWNDKYLIDDSSTLVLGESYLGLVTVDLSKIPHILLGGSTGSGKSVLLKLLLMQMVKKNAVVNIADFKGGVDFPKIWHEKCRMCFEEDTLVELLTELVEELEARKVIFRKYGCPNIDEYNQQTGANLQRFVFACDEVAEVLDKVGLTKEQKEKVSLIESKLSIIARQGRAFGIHLILATQRPDANILSGQIRNNIDCRVCGRADMVLSQIILDDTSAANLIPKDAAGRFLLHDGTMFQAYIFDENNFKWV